MDLRPARRVALIAAAAAALAAAAPAVARERLHPVRLASGTYLVAPHGRHGIKPIAPSPAPAAGRRVYLNSAAKHGATATLPAVYLVFWGSQWSHDPAGAKPALQAFFTGLFGPADPWSNVLTQYCSGLTVGTKTCGSGGVHIVHPSATPLAGVWADNAAAAPRRATQAQIAGEAVAAAQHFGNTSKASNFDAIYVIASASGTHPDRFPNSLFCAWHSSTGSSFGNIAYTNLPYVPDLGAGACTTLSSPTLLDGYFSTETHEFAESVTDLWPLRGWLDGGGSEIADLCVALDTRETLSTGSFDVQGIWSNAAGHCVTS
jgi:hypothetical protein